MRVINATEGLDATGRKTQLSLAIEGGRITRIGAVGDAPEDVIILPALVNAHDHARPLRSSSVGGFGKPLETWLHRLAMMAPVDPYLATLAPLARAALGGQGAVMIHHVRAMGLTDYMTEAEQIARAARDVGMRVAFGIGMRDCNPLVYGAHDQLLASLEAPVRAEIEGRFLSQPMMPIKDQLARVDAVAAQSVDRAGGEMGQFPGIAQGAHDASVPREHERRSLGADLELAADLAEGVTGAAQHRNLSHPLRNRRDIYGGRIQRGAPSFCLVVHGDQSSGAG
jgi:hypothetical protein